MEDLSHGTVDSIDGKAANRKAYMDWLRGEIEKWCDENGFFQMEWDYDDSITPDQIIDAWEHFEGEGYASPLDYLEGELLKSPYVDAEDNFYGNYLLRDLDSAPDAVREGWDAAQSIWDDLTEAGYQGIDLNINQLIRQSDFKVNVFFATEAEQNFDMGSIVDCFGNVCTEADIGRAEPVRLDNALSYLVNQQGHSVRELYGELVLNKPSDSALIGSIRCEIGENLSEAMSEVCALVHMEGEAMFDFLNGMERNADSIVLAKDSATMGIFNQWSGCGSALDIQLEKDAIFPFSMVRGFQIEGQPSVQWDYTVGDVYGLTSDCWKDCLTISDIPVKDPREDYDHVISQVKAELKHVEGQFAQDRDFGCDLDAEDRDARDASASLRECAPSAGHGIEER